MSFSTALPQGSDTGALVVAQLLQNDKLNKVLDDSAVLTSGFVRGNVVKYSVALGKWILCDGTVDRLETDIIGIVENVNGTSGQVRLSGVYTDSSMTTTAVYYCQSNGTLGTTVTKVFVGVISSPGNLCMPGGGGGSIKIASDTVLGGIKVGSGLQIDSNGVLNPGNLPSWFYERGDGSDGAYNPTVSTNLAGGIYNFTSINIPSGVTISCTGPVEIKCQGACIVAGILTASGKSATSTDGGWGMIANGGNGAPSGTEGNTASPGGAGIAGGVGGAGYTQLSYNGGVGGGLTLLCNGKLPVTDIAYVISHKLTFSGGGGGGGAAMFNGGYSYRATGGGGGGGSIYIVAKSVSNTGSILANGGNGVTVFSDNHNGPGGGGGGGIVIVADIILNSGAITANGGASIAGNPGTPGTNGLVYLKQLEV